jgi:hypothetical protein
MWLGPLLSPVYCWVVRSHVHDCRYRYTHISSTLGIRFVVTLLSRVDPELVENLERDGLYVTGTV